jgi:hypothetical protein
MRALSSLALTAVAAACGPMPGYRGPDYPAEPAASESAASDEASERAKAAPAVDEAPPSEGSRWSEADEVPDVEPPRVPPPRRVEPEVASARPAPDSGSRGAPAATPASSPSPSQRGARVIELDPDSAYIVDDARGLCFFRHKAALAPVDCARVTQPAPEQPAPAQPAPRTEPAPPVQPAPAAQPARFTADQLRRFELAFTAIFCDSVAKTATPSETRLREAGIDGPTYDAIETWTADDDKRWVELNARASSACKPTR